MINEQTLIKMAQMQTIIGCIVFLTGLKERTHPYEHNEIDEMILRLTNMAKTLS